MVRPTRNAAAWAAKFENFEVDINDDESDDPNVTRASKLKFLLLIFDFIGL